MSNEQKLRKIIEKWKKHHFYAKDRARKKNRTFTLTLEETKSLWERDNADKLISPSIDRIDNDKGYSLENCRFIERSENSRIGNLNRPTSVKQKEAARKNMMKWVLSDHVHPRKGMNQGTCIEDGCENRAITKGICQKHYSKKRYREKLSKYREEWLHESRG